MADYDPLIPQPNDLISESQSDILNNFGQLNTIFNSDHFTWNSSPSAKRGAHRKVTFATKLTSDPVLGSNDGIFFPKEDANDTSLREQLYFKNPTETVQITNRFHLGTATGYWMMPGGGGLTPSLIFMWGNVLATSFTDDLGPAGSFFDVTFQNLSSYTGSPSGFPNSLFNIQLTLNYSDFTPKTAQVDELTVPPTTTGFRILCTARKLQFDSVWWFAIGT